MNQSKYETILALNDKVRGPKSIRSRQKAKEQLDSSRNALPNSSTSMHFSKLDVVDDKK